MPNDGLKRVEAARERVGNPHESFELSRIWSYWRGRQTSELQREHALEETLIEERLERVQARPA